MTLNEFLLVFSALFISDIFWVKCVRSVNQEEPFQAGLWAIGIFLPTALGTVAYVANPWLLVPACLGHFAGTMFTVWVAKHRKSKIEKTFEDTIRKFEEFARENQGREFR